MVVDPLTAALQHLPLVAILRGIKPAEAAEHAAALYESDFRVIEVPLNSPDPLTTLRTLVSVLPGDTVIGAGTVLNTEQVDAIARIGVRLVVTPHASRAVSKAATTRDLITVPGIATPTEAFDMVSAGARWLKLFPARHFGSEYLRDLTAVLPGTVRVIAVGGIAPDSGALEDWFLAGAYAFGTGTALYSPGQTIAETAQRAKYFTEAVKQAKRRVGSNAK